MTYVARIELTNWLRFRSVAIDLGPRDYAIEAELEGDPARSNWLAKTGVCESLPFAFYGWHRFQEGERAPGFEDRWIYGRPGIEREIADSGGVAIGLSTGFRIERSRIRGFSAALLLIRPDGSRVAGDTAQREIDSIIGLSRDDFFSTAFVRQKLCAQLVMTSPAGRMSLIADWLDFGKLEDAGRLLARRVSDRASERDRFVGRAGDLQRRIAELEAEEHFGFRLSDSANVEREAALAIEEAQRAVNEAQGRFEARARWEAGERERAAKEGLLRQLSEAESELAALRPIGTAPDTSAAEGRARTTLLRFGEATRVARGDFDGRCPVLPGFECPARVQINEAGEPARKALSIARAEKDAAESARVEVRALRFDYETKLQTRVRAEERVATLRSRQGTESQLSVPEPPFGSRADVDTARSKLESLRTAFALFRRSVGDLSKLHSELSDTNQKQLAAETALLHSRAARLVVGRGGAQRRIAERAVDLIARGANARLASIGVDLRVSLSWRREGTEPAASCEACGASFPKTTKVRVCSRCGAERGKQQHDRLDVDLSDRSGAAEDLVGLALQRSACAFLRRRRGAPWASLVLDEPFGALDECHRGAVARSVARAREEDAIEQLFVVAHDRGVLDSLPAKILIRGRGEDSVIEVIE